MTLITSHHGESLERSHVYKNEFGSQCCGCVLQRSDARLCHIPRASNQRAIRYRAWILHPAVHLCDLFITNNRFRLV